MTVIAMHLRTVMSFRVEDHLRSLLHGSIARSLVASLPRMHPQYYATCTALRPLAKDRKSVPSIDIYDLYYIGDDFRSVILSVNCL